MTDNATLITRKSFIKGSAAAAVLAGLGVFGAGCTPVAPADNGGAGGAGTPLVNNDQEFLTACRGSCTLHCPIKAVVRDGKLVRTTAATLSTIGLDNARICAKGSSWPYVVYSENRIQYPYKRVGERGSGQWEQITWDQAISEVSAKLNDIRSQYGNGSIVISFEGGNLAPSTNGSYARWAGVIGASKLGANNDQAYIQASAYHGGGSPDYENATNILLFGEDMPASGPHSYRPIADGLVNGAKLVVVNPLFNSTASKADIFAPIRPSTDGALVMACIRYIEEKGLSADDFLKANTVAPFLVKASDGKYLRKSDLNGGAGKGEKDDSIIVWDSAANAYGFAPDVANPEIRGSFEVEGIAVSTAYQLLLERVEPYTLGKASRICDLSESMIKDIAEAAADNSALYYGRGTDHYHNSIGACMGFVALQCVTGSLHFLPGRNAPAVYWPLTGFGLDEEGHPEMGPVEISPFMLTSLSKTGVCELPGGGGKTVEQAVKAVCLMAGGKMSAWPNRNQNIELVKSLELFITADINWGDCSQFADYVLPAASQPEVYDIINSMNYIVYCERTIDPIFEAKPDFEIAKLLCDGMGFEEWFKDFTADDFLQVTINGNPTLSGMGMKIEDLKRDKFYEFKDPTTPTAFRTAVGKAAFYLETPKPMKDYGQVFDVERARLPWFDAPFEAWPETVDEYEKNPLADKYPLIYWTGPRRYRTHSHFNCAPNLRELDIEPSVFVNPKDASERGIADGDTVRLFNDRGQCVARAVINNGLRPGIVDMDRGWQFGQYKVEDSHHNNLTHMVMEPECLNHSYYDVLCQMEKM